MTTKIEDLATSKIRDYTKHVATERALPHIDVKPVHRRMLWSMMELSARSGYGKYTKCSTIVGSCFTGDTKISLLNGAEVPIKDLVGLDEFWVYSCKPDGTIVPGRGHSARVTKTTNQICEVTLDNNEVIRCTPDHRFMLRDGTYKEAQYLTPNDSLMPLYRRINDKGYEEYKDNASDKWIQTHQMVAYDVHKGAIKECWRDIKENNKPDRFLVVHHCHPEDPNNKRNNDPSNLKWMGEHDHWIFHSKLAGGGFPWHDQLFREKMKSVCSKNGKNNWPMLQSSIGPSNLRRIKNPYYMNIFINSTQLALRTKQLKDPKFFHNRALSSWRSIRSNAQSYNKFVELGRLSKNLINYVYSDKNKKDKSKKCVEFNSSPLIKKKQQRGKVLNFLNSLVRKGYVINQSTYNSEKYQQLPRYEYVIKEFGSLENAIEQAKTHNHKVVGVSFVNTQLDVYDITVDVYNNFSLSSGVVVHNSMSYHPHGDDSIYGALCTLVNCPNALIEGRGNFGSPYGDRAAASRYTEAKTSPLFEELIDNSMYDVGNFEPNYDNTKKIPVQFETKLPLSMLISCQGIGVGIATSLPAYHVDYVIALIKSIINNTPAPDKSYAYGACVIDSRLYPKTKIIKEDGKEYLQISELPIGSDVSILMRSKLIHELMSSKSIEIIDDSKLRNISIKVHAPEYIQRLIINSISKPIIERFSYYNKKIKWTPLDYTKDWLEHRREFIKKREWNKESKIWTENVIKEILTKLNDHKKEDDFQETIVKVATDVYNTRVKVFDAGSRSYIPNLDDLISNIKSKPISMIKVHEYSIVNPIYRDNVDDIIIAELDNINTKLFSPKSIPLSGITYAKFSGEVTRYIVRTDNGFEVRYQKAPRVMNWATSDKILAVYSDGKLEQLDDFFFGKKETEGDKKVVGFSIPTQSNTVYVTESDKLMVRVRLGTITEPIKSAYPARKISVNNKEYSVKSGLQLDSASSVKILEI